MLCGVLKSLSKLETLELILYLGGEKKEEALMNLSEGIGISPFLQEVKLGLIGEHISSLHISSLHMTQFFKVLKPIPLLRSFGFSIYENITETE